jgi:hypothetical protein
MPNTKNPKTVCLEIAEIVVLADMQMRVNGLSEDHVHDLEKATRSRVKLTKVKVRFVEGTGYILTDGFHTLEGAKRAGKKMIDCSMLKGTYHDAIMDAAAANKSHLALKRTQADKRKAAKAAIEALESAGVKWAAKRIAEHVGVSDDLIHTLLKDREELDKPEAVPLKLKPVVQPTELPWKRMPVSEICDPKIFEGLPEEKRPATVGELHERMRANERFKLSLKDYHTLAAAVEEITGQKLPVQKPTEDGEEPEVPKNGKPVVDWKDGEQKFGQLVRFVDDVARHHPEKGNQRDFHAARRLLDELGKHLLAWKKQYAEKVA